MEVFVAMLGILFGAIHLAVSTVAYRDPKAPAGTMWVFLITGGLLVLQGIMLIP